MIYVVNRLDYFRQYFKVNSKCFSVWRHLGYDAGIIYKKRKYMKIIIIYSLFSDTDGFTPQLQIPITTQLDQQQHMGLVQWWVQSKHRHSLCGKLQYLVTSVVRTRHLSHLPYYICQQASLYRGGYNRFTPYWDTQRSLFWSLGLADLWTLQGRLWNP